MNVNETLCFNEQDIEDTIKLIEDTGFSYHRDGMTLYFWR